jgi:hypothetical protein
MKRPSRDLDLALGSVIEAKEMVAPGWSMAGAERAGWRSGGSGLSLYWFDPLEYRSSAPLGTLQKNNEVLE